MDGPTPSTSQTTNQPNRETKEHIVWAALHFMTYFMGINYGPIVVNILKKNHSFVKDLITKSMILFF